MNMDLSKYKIGLRTTKTALAVFICLFIHLIFGTEMGLYSCIAAVVCMKETVGASWQTGLHRFLGTVIGGLLGFLLVTVAQHMPHYQDGLYILVIPLGLILCIWSCMLIHKRNGVIICCVVFIGIGLDPAMDKFGTASNVLLRVVDTMVGIIVAGLVNRFVFPYSEEEEAQEQGPEEVK